MLTRSVCGGEDERKEGNLFQNADVVLVLGDGIHDATHGKDAPILRVVPAVIELGQQQHRGPRKVTRFF